MAYAPQASVPFDARHSLLYCIYHGVIIAGVTHGKIAKLRLDLVLCRHRRYTLSNVDPGVRFSQTRQPQQDRVVDAHGIQRIRNDFKKRPKVKIERSQLMGPSEGASRRNCLLCKVRSW